MGATMYRPRRARAGLMAVMLVVGLASASDPARVTMTGLIVLPDVVASGEHYDVNLRVTNIGGGTSGINRLSLIARSGMGVHETIVRLPGSGTVVGPLRPGESRDVTTAGQPLASGQWQIEANLELPKHNEEGVVPSDIVDQRIWARHLTVR